MKNEKKSISKLKIIAMILALILNIEIIMPIIGNINFAGFVNASTTAITSDERFEYIQSSNGLVMITKYLKNEIEVTIPEKINGGTVAYISSDVFEKSQNVEIVNIPASVISIDEYTWGNGNLKRINVNDENKNYISVDGILFNKDKTKLIKCPPKAIVNTGYTIPDSVTSIETQAFDGCAMLTSINIPDSVTSIGIQAFDGCTMLTSVNIPNSVTEIKRGAFSHCKELTTVNIPASVTNIGSSVFYLCTSLKNVNIEEGFENIQMAMFSNCTSLTNITIPNSVSNIGEEAFINCTSLTEIIIPNSVISIGKAAFFKCNNLKTEIFIPSSVTSIGWRAFQNFYVNVDSENKNYSSEDGILFDKNKTVLINYPKYIKRDVEYTIPDTVVSIYDYAFANDTVVKTIKTTSESRLTSIGEYAFYACNQNLKRIDIPDSVTSIGKNAFSGCFSLSDITIPKNIISIGEGAFSSCKLLKSINIPSSVTSIGKQAFSGCVDLTTVYLYCDDLTLDSTIFNYCKNIKKIYVNEGTKCEESVLNLKNNLGGTEIIYFSEIPYEATSQIRFITQPEYKNGKVQFKCIERGDNVEGILYYKVVPSNEAYKEQEYRYCALEVENRNPKPVGINEKYSAQINLWGYMENLQKTLYNQKYYVKIKDAQGNEFKSNDVEFKCDIPVIIGGNINTEQCENVFSTKKDDANTEFYLKEGSKMIVHFKYKNIIYPEKKNITINKDKLLVVNVENGIAGTEKVADIDIINNIYNSDKEQYECDIVITATNSVYNGEIRLIQEEGVLTNDDNNVSSEDLRVNAFLNEYKLYMDNSVSTLIKGEFKNDKVVYATIKDEYSAIETIQWKLFKYGNNKYDDELIKDYKEQDVKDDNGNYTNEIELKKGIPSTCKQNEIKDDSYNTYYYQLTVKDVLGNTTIYEFKPKTKYYITHTENDNTSDTIKVYTITTNTPHCIDESVKDKTKEINKNHKLKIAELNYNSEKLQEGKDWARKFELLIFTNRQSITEEIEINDIMKNEQNNFDNLKLTVDNQKPVITLDSTIPQKNVKNMTLRLKITDEGKGLKQYRTLINGKYGTIKTIKEENIKDGVLTVKLNVVKNGNYAVYVWDKDGNMTEWTQEITNIDEEDLTELNTTFEINNDEDVNVTINLSKDIKTAKSIKDNVEWTITENRATRTFDESVVNDINFKDNIEIEDFVGNKITVDIKDGLAPRHINTIKTPYDDKEGYKIAVVFSEAIQLPKQDIDEVIINDWKYEGNSKKIIVKENVTENEILKNIKDLSGNDMEEDQIDIKIDGVTETDIVESIVTKPAKENGLLKPTKEVKKIYYLNREIKAIQLTDFLKDKIKNKTKSEKDLISGKDITLEEIKDSGNNVISYKLTMVFNKKVISNNNEDLTFNVIIYDESGLNETISVPIKVNQILNIIKKGDINNDDVIDQKDVSEFQKVYVETIQYTNKWHITEDVFTAEEFEKIDANTNLTTSEKNNLKFQQRAKFYALNMVNNGSSAEVLDFEDYNKFMIDQDLNPDEFDAD